MEFLNFAWISMIIFMLLSGLLLRKTSKSASKLPPGPAPLPIIGNLHIISHLPHRSFSTLAHKYGPIMTLYLGSLPTIVISSSEMAKQVLKTQDHVFASRPPMGDDNHILSAQKFSISPYGPYWKFMRKVLIQEILSPKRLKSFTSLKAEEVFVMIRSILKKSNTALNSPAVDVTREVSLLTNNTICRMSFGKKCNEAELGGRIFKDVLDELLASAAGFNYSECIPLLGWLDLQGLQRKQARLTETFHVFLDKTVDEHFERRKNGSSLECEDFMDMLVSLSEDESMEFKITQSHIKNVTFVYIHL